MTACFWKPLRSVLRVTSEALSGVHIMLLKPARFMAMTSSGVTPAGLRPNLGAIERDPPALSLTDQLTGRLEFLNHCA
jgi:hypothetical protein